MRNLIGLAVIAVIGFYLYHELRADPEPRPAPSPHSTGPRLPKTLTDIVPGALKDLTLTDKQRALRGSLPSGYDPAYIHPETRDFTKPTVTLRRSERAFTANPADAPTQCGPYFIYYHPRYYKGPKPQPTRIITVSKTPPDWDVESLFQLWAFEIKRTHENSYPVIERGRYVERNDVRPVQFAEATGMYVANHICKPYKPLTLTCSKFSPWC